MVISTYTHYTTRKTNKSHPKNGSYMIIYVNMFISIHSAFCKHLKTSCKSSQKKTVDTFNPSPFRAQQSSDIWRCCSFPELFTSGVAEFPGERALSDFGLTRTWWFIRETVRTGDDTVIPETPGNCDRIWDRKKGLVMVSS